MTTQALSTFDFRDHALRVVPGADGQPWFVAKDAAEILGYRDATNALRSVPEHHKGTHSVSTPGGAQEMLCVDEPGLYRLILRSQRPEAEPFMEWVTAEVLPSIRQHGGYLHGDMTALTELLDTQRKLIAAQEGQMAEVKRQAEARVAAAEQTARERNYELTRRVERLRSDLEDAERWHDWATWALGPMDDPEGTYITALRRRGLTWTQIARDHSYRSPGSLSSQYRRWQERRAEAGRGVPA